MDPRNPYLPIQLKDLKLRNEELFAELKAAAAGGASLRGLRYDLDRLEQATARYTIGQAVDEFYWEARNAQWDVADIDTGLLNLLLDLNRSYALEAAHGNLRVLRTVLDFTQEIQRKVRAPFMERLRHRNIQN